MMNTTQRNKIVSSYASVLVDIIRSTGNTKQVFDIVEKCVESIQGFVNFQVTPATLNSYKDCVKNVSKELDRNNAIELFFYNLLDRRYLFLTNEIYNVVKIKLQNELNKNIVEVFSSFVIDEKLKNSINDIISKQVKDACVEYKINKNMDNNTVDFVANGKICSINLQKMPVLFLKF